MCCSSTKSFDPRREGQTSFSFCLQVSSKGKLLIKTSVSLEATKINGMQVKRGRVWCKTTSRICQKIHYNPAILYVSQNFGPQNIRSWNLSWLISKTMLMAYKILSEVSKMKEINLISENSNVCYEDYWKAMSFPAVQWSRYSKLVYISHCINKMLISLFFLQFFC
jgi:hypothetical protein